MKLPVVCENFRFWKRINSIGLKNPFCSMLIPSLISFGLAFCGCLGLRFVYLGVPGSLSKGDPTWLDCGYDLEGDKLYSVKWYKDKVEFYRYLPSENQSKQMFSLDGVFLDLERCNATHASLYTSDFDTEGTYGCEVSIEVPSYRTIMSEKELRIHVIPDGNPNVFGFLKSYDVGDVVNLTCIFGPSKPAAKLSWYLNAEEAPSSYVHVKLPFPTSSDKLKMSESRLIFPLEPHHLWQGFLAVECSAFLSQVHETSSLELIFGEGTSGGMFQRILHAPPGREAPVITGGRSRYYVGDIVSLNCSSFRSKELPQLEWHINGEQAKADFVTSYPPTHYLDHLYSSKLGLEFRVLNEHLRDGEMRLKCTATISSTIRRTSAEILLLGDGYRSSSFQLSDRSTAGSTSFTELTLCSVVFLLCVWNILLS